MAMPTLACRINLPPKERTAHGYVSGAISAVVLVRVASSAHTAEPSGDAKPWRAVATVERVVRGSYLPAQVVFERGWGSSACDDGHLIARVGELWVVYFWKQADGKQLVWQSYPAATAFRADTGLSIGR